MHKIEITNIWKRNLAKRKAKKGKQDEHAEEREKFRDAFISFRERVIQVAEGLDESLKTLTVHGITHIDALWGIADQIIDDEFLKSPLEAFILGGAYLLHDLGLALAVYPRGLDELREDPYWQDCVAQRLRNTLRRPPTSEEIQIAPEEITEIADEDTLRYFHAKKAEMLCSMPFRNPIDNSEYFLIDDPDIRNTYGRLIGRIARSHGINIEEVEKEFSIEIGSYPGCPSDWKINPLKIACLLRVCDACHLDALRAPGFLKELKKPTGAAALHWRFQEKIQTPYVKNEQIYFTSSQPFGFEDRDAWWLGYDLLRQADQEIHAVNTLLNETKSPILRVWGVAGALNPQQLSMYIKTDGWKPVDTSLRITDAVKIVNTLAGKELYGSNPTIPLRELIQNARDAVTARRILEKDNNYWGRITVRVFSEKEMHWLEVEDDGIGMSEAVLSGPMIDFGQSYWDSELAKQEWPGLISSQQFQPTGKYGIGFFSVFMIGEYVKVVSRQNKDGKEETRVLEFTNGLKTRSFLRSATSDEQRNKFGTSVRIQLQTKPRDKGGILGPMRVELSHDYYIYRDIPWQLKDLCEWLCPALDVDLITEEYGNSQIAIQANDWETLPPEMLLRRLIIHGNPKDEFWNKEPIKSCLGNLKIIKNNQGQIIGRAFIWPKLEMDVMSVEQLRTSGVYSQYPLHFEGVITDGAFRGTTRPETIGIWLGRSCRVSRYRTEPLVADYPFQLMEWASEQAERIINLNIHPLDKIRAAEIVRASGANTGPLPIAIGKNGKLSFSDIAGMRNLPEEVVLFPAKPRLEGWESQLKEIDDGKRLNENAFGVLNWRSRTWLFLGDQEDPKKRANHPAWRCYWMSIWGAVIEAIAIAWDVDLQKVLEISNIIAWNVNLKKMREFSNIKISRREDFTAVIGVDSNGKDLEYNGVDIIRKPS